MDEVQLEAAPEAAAQVGGVHLDLLGRHSADLRAEALRPGLELRRCPDVHTVGPDVGGAVHGLHGGVGEERQLIDRLDALRRAAECAVGVAVMSRHYAGLPGAFGEEL